MEVRANPLDRGKTLRGGNHVFSVLLLDDQGHHSQAVASCLGQVPGVQLHVLSNEPQAPVRFSRYCKTFHLLRSQGGEAIPLDQVKRAIHATNAQIFLPTVESGIRFAIAHRGELEKLIHLVPLSDLDTLELVSDKHSLAQFLTRNGMPSPETQLLPSSEEIEKDHTPLSFPLLLKPTRGSGGFGIHRFENRTSLLQSLKTHPEQKSCILQSYVRGYDLGCSFLAQNGNLLALTIQGGLPKKNPYGPCELIEFVRHDATLDAIRKLVTALNWNGVAHVDLRCDEQGNPFVIDFNPRYWLSLLGSLAAGVNFPYLSCLTALGVEFPPPEYEQVNYFPGAKGMARIVRGDFQFSAGGKWKSGLRYAMADPGPRAFNLWKKIGRAFRR